MKLSVFSLILFSVLAACAQSIDSCEDCELLMEGMPASLSWTTSLSEKGEPGEPLVISGTIFKRDGKTPAQGVILYVYHTNTQGNYVAAKGQTNGRRHGHLRGWVKTDERGCYTFSTIRPGSYPNRRDPQHIHPIIKEASGVYYWIDAFLFEDDPKLTEKEKTSQPNRGGSGILSLRKNDKGVWIGKRDIILGLHVPNYK
ncbi:MAG: intradiol ring-cleavage dioxygenase [Cytophagales bacterium]|nr:intradiol ring-cleavage dioxygenase [Cytophagales bacterium]